MRPRSRNDQTRLDDIRVACSLIVDRLQDKKFPDFVADLSLQDGIIRRLEMIGEASKNITEATRKRYPTVQWRDLMRLRDRAIHRYWDLDSLMLWKIAREDVPALLDLLETKED